jgi:hypothetical protein
MTYRGDTTEEWSNKYWLTGTPPNTSADWRTLFDAMVNLEHTCYTARSVVVSGIAYDDNSDGAHAVWTVDLAALGQTVPGALTEAAGHDFAGDQVGVVEWRTNRKNSRGKWIYLRKYFHSGIEDFTDPDLIAGTTKGNYTAFASHLFLGDTTMARKIRSQKQDEDLASHQVSDFTTTRTLKRRGRRP